MTLVVCVAHMTLVAGVGWMTLVVCVAHMTLVAGVTWKSLVVHVTWMMTLVAGVNSMILVALVALVDLVALAVLVAMATLAVDGVCLVGPSYGGFPVREEIPFQLYLYLLQSLQIFWGDVPGFQMACILVSRGALQNGVSHMTPFGIDLLGAGSHRSPCLILHA